MAKKRGRPPLGDKGKIKVFHLRMTIEDYNRLTELAEKNNIAIAALIRNLVNKSYEESKMKVYMVVAEGYMELYGSKTYCIGVYSTKDSAEKAANEYHEFVKRKADEYCYDEEEDEDEDEDDEYEILKHCAEHKEAAVRIVELNLDETYKMMISGAYYTGFKNDKYLGGYIE